MLLPSFSSFLPVLLQAPLLPLANLAMVVMLAPLIAAIITGFFGFICGKRLSHSIAILAVFISAVGACLLLYRVVVLHEYYNGTIYNWLTVGGINFSVGMLCDSLTAIMLVVVTSVSLMVHIYTIGYMASEDGYTRFFSYISLFTFMMLTLVLANNFVQLFFGWEGVGLVSYLLIGFYYKRQSATFAGLKAFLINRIGDCGFLLGIALVLTYCGSLDYVTVFHRLSSLSDIYFLHSHYDVITVICVLLFIGAMGKSAQFPLHVWLPDSMEGPTPISALIHAATMVTAGIFMVARLSPMYNLSTTALSLIIIVGGINCLFMGLLGIIQNDIKRVVAYSTLSQLGYMAVALGCGAYSVAIFHLMTHAFFKGLLFLAAGSVIVALHHEQDMRKMGGLAKYMPITYLTMLIGSLALAGIPPFAGFFSKDLILEAATATYLHGRIFAGGFAVFTVYASVLVTAIYSFRLIFMTFHGKESFISHDDHGHLPQESPWVITLPLVLMAIMSLVVGYIAFNCFAHNTILSGVVINSAWYNEYVANEVSTPFKMVTDSVRQIPVYLALMGIIIAWLSWRFDSLRKMITKSTAWALFIMRHNYFMDAFYINLLAPTGRLMGKLLYTIGDKLLIDGLVVNGVAHLISWYAWLFRKIQSGYVNSYATFMIFGIILFLTFCTRLILA